MTPVTYDLHYQNDPAACGAPFSEFARFAATAPPGSVLDLGCGQGRDTLLFARRGHQVLAVDVSTVGLAQLDAVAVREGLAVETRVADIVGFSPDRTFDAVILDRVLHMLAPADRLGVLEVALAATAPGGHLLVAEGPKGLLPVVERVLAAGWATPKRTRNRLIAQRPAG